MRLIITGCEYSGTTTIANAVCRWAERAMGARIVPHDHFKTPDVACYPQGVPAEPLTEKERGQILALSPKLKEMLQRQDIVYHYPMAGQGPDWVMVGYHIEDAVYGPLYFGYGLADEPQGGPRSRYARTTEVTIVQKAPDTVLVLVTASPEVIAGRMKDAPHHGGVLRDSDVERVLHMFQEEYASSVVRNKITLDTSAATVDESLEELVRKLGPLLTDADRLRMLDHRSIGA